MLSKYRKKILLLVGLLLLFNSCFRLVKDDFPEFGQKPVLNSFLIADSLIVVHLSYTASLLDTSVLLVENADVSIQNSEGWQEILSYEGEGYYTSSYRAEAGHTYRCEAIVPGFQPISATATVPQQPVILSDVVFTPVADRDEEGYAISSYRFTIENDSNQTCFWELAFLEQRKSFWSDEIEKHEHYFYLDPGANMVMRHESQPLTLFSNKNMLLTHYTIEMLVPFWNGDLGDSYIELRAVDEAYYLYGKSYALYETSGGSGLGTSTQSYPLYSNVKNGLGIFAAYTPLRFSVQMAKQN